MSKTVTWAEDSRLHKDSWLVAKQSADVRCSVANLIPHFIMKNAHTKSFSKWGFRAHVTIQGGEAVLGLQLSRGLRFCDPASLTSPRHPQLIVQSITVKTLKRGMGSLIMQALRVEAAKHGLCLQLQCCITEGSVGLAAHLNMKMHYSCGFLCLEN